MKKIKYGRKGSRWPRRRLKMVLRKVEVGLERLKLLFKKVEDCLEEG